MANFTQKSKRRYSTTIKRSRIDQSTEENAVVQHEALQNSLTSWLSTNTKSGIQAKLEVSSPDDSYEQEANAVADKVVGMSDKSNNARINKKEAPSFQLQAEKEEEPQAKLIQRENQEEEKQEEEKQVQAKFIQRQAPEEEEKTVQAKSTSTKLGVPENEDSTGIEDKLNSSTGQGSPLPDSTRSSMEGQFGVDFGQVRVHTDTNAVQMNKELGAQAFTHGNDIYFNSGKYNPESSSGKHLLAHELTHTIQQGSSSLSAKKSIQRTPYQTAQQRGNSSNPIDVAVQAIKSNYSEIGATWLTVHLVAGIIYAEGELNTDVTDLIGDWLGTSGSAGPGQLSSGAITQVDARIPLAAHQQFAAQFGAAPTSWRDKAMDDNWVFFYTAGYLAWCMTEAADKFKAIDGATSHIPLGIAIYQGAFNTMKYLRRRIADEKGIAWTDVTWQMVMDAERNTPGSLSHKEHKVLDYVQLAAGGFDFHFQINALLNSRTFVVPEGHVKVHSTAAYTNSSVPIETGDHYYIQLMEIRESGDSEFSMTSIVEKTKVSFLLGQQQVYEWTGLLRGYQYYLKITNENPNEINGSGKVEYLY